MCTRKQLSLIIITLALVSMTKLYAQEMRGEAQTPMQRVIVITEAEQYAAANIPPDPPGLFAPPNGSTNITTSPTVSWNVSDRATSYGIQVSTASDFSTTVVNQTGIALTSYSISNLSNNTTYYWHVNASNTAGTSDWSATWSFTTVAGIPPAPTLLSPGDGTITSTAPLLTWNPAGGARSYRLQVSLNSSFTPTLGDESNITSTSIQLNNLNDNTKYYWRVNAENTNGTSPWSTVWSFNTPAIKPTIPTLVSPPDGATNVPINIMMTWNSAIGAASYHIQISMSPTFTPLVVDQGNFPTTSYPVNNLTSNTKYYWRVNATNAAGPSDWSTVWSFTTIKAKPLAPILVSPTDNATNIPLNPTLTWNTSAGADSYRLQVATNAAFTSMKVDSPMTTTSFALSGLKNNETYYWRVNASNSGGVSDWSSVWKFNTPIVSVKNNPTDESFSLEQNFPNPFSHSTAINYKLSVASHVRLEVMDLLGRNIATLVDAVQEAGDHSIRFGLSEATHTLNPGIYLYRMISGNKTFTMKMVFVK